VKLLDNAKDRQISWIIGATAFLVAIVVDFVRGFEYVILQSDGRNDYLTQANEMVLGLNYMIQNPNQLGHGIGFSYLIALTFIITGSQSLVTVKIIFAIFHGLTAYLISKIGQDIGLKRYGWLIASSFYMLDPFVLFSTSDITTEPITALAVVYWAYLFLRSENKGFPTFIHLCTFAFTGFFLVTARPNAILPLLVITFFLIRKWVQESNKKSHIISASLLFVLPLTIYEAIISRIYKGFVFLSPAGGINAEFMCSKEFVPQYIGFISNSENHRINNWWYGASKVNEVIESQKYLSVPKINSELWQIGINKCLESPLESIFVLLVKPFALWRPYVVYGAYGSTVFWLSLLLWVPLTISMIYFVLRKNLSLSQSLLRKYFLIIAFSFTISLQITPTQIRHRVAFAESFYWIFFAFAASKILTMYSSKRQLSKSNKT